MDVEQLLPDSLDKLAQFIGVDACIKLAVTWPGVRLYIPKTVHAGHPIAKCIGLPAAQLLSAKRGDLRVSIPRNFRYRLALRRERILQRYWQGESAATLAREYGLHEYTIYNWAVTQKSDGASPQASLF